MKIILVSLTLFTLLVMPATVLAEEESATTRPTIEEKIQKRVENREERRVEFAKKHSERIQRRFDAYYARLTKIIAKIKTRIIDNTEATTKLTEASIKLEEAKKLGDGAVVLFNSLTTGNLGSNSEVVENAKEKANDARNAFIETRELIREAFKLTKPDGKE